MTLRHVTPTGERPTRTRYELILPLGVLMIVRARRLVRDGAPVKAAPAASTPEPDADETPATIPSA